MSDFYILNDNHEPVSVADVLEWARWMEGGAMHGIDRRRVAHTQLAEGDISISTVFLGVDHNHARHFGGRDSRPILFETMIFGGLHDGEQWRYHTWSEAEAGHAAAVATAKGGLD